MSDCLTDFEKQELSQVAISRREMGNGGDIVDYVQSEQNLSETVRMALYNSAVFDGAPVSKWKLLDDSYRGTGGYETGEYLIPHPREQQDKFNRRKKLSYYANFVKPVVDAQVNPIFKSKPTRHGISSEYQSFIENVDGNNMHLDRFMKKAAIRAKLHGVEFIVMDMEQLDNTTVLTKKDIIDNRLFPYLYLVSPADVEDWATDKFGRLIMIKYCVKNTIVDSKGRKKLVTEHYTWTSEICIIEDADGKREIENPIGVIPVIPIYGTINNIDDLIPQSDIYSIARTNHALFNATSELRERNRAQAFSVLVYPISEDDDYESGAETMRYGTADMLLYRGDSSGEPKFITPPEASSTILEDEIKSMIDLIYRMAMMKDTQTISQYNVSAVAKEYDNQNLYQVILELATGLQKAEEMLCKLFELFTGESQSGFTVVYNQQFGIIDPTEALNNATQSLSLNISPEFNAQVKRQVIRSVLNTTDGNTVDEIVKLFEDSPTAGEGLQEGQGQVVQQVSGR